MHRHAWCFYVDLGSWMGSSCLQSKHVTEWAVMPAPDFPFSYFFYLFSAERHWRRLQVPTIRGQTKFISFSSSWFLLVAVSQSDPIVFSSLCKRSAQIHQLFTVRNELSAAEIICPACAVYGKEGTSGASRVRPMPCVADTLSPASFFFFLFCTCVCALSGWVSGCTREC